VGHESIARRRSERKASAVGASVATKAVIAGKSVGNEGAVVS
jgi:hypothetical protein